MYEQYSNLIDYTIIAVVFFGLVAATLKIGISVFKKSKILAFLIPVLFYVPVALLNFFFGVFGVTDDIGGAILGIISIIGFSIAVIMNSVVLIIIWLRKKKKDAGSI